MVVIVFERWRYFPFAFLFILARLQAIPDELYEAASVDGATPYQRFRHITLPQLVKEGRIIQIGIPEEIYRYPADTFVARFIGSPEMNLFKGVLSWKNDEAYFEGNGYSIRLGKVRALAGPQELEMGIRPEHIVIGRGMDGIDAIVELINDVGGERHIHAKVGYEEMVIRAPYDLRVKEGDRLTVTIDPSKIHLLQKGKRIE